MNRIIISLLVLSTMLLAQDFEYVGTMGCKMCHNKDATGAQFSKWEASTHANAFETLKSDHAAKIVQEKGIDTYAWETPECVICHTTGFDNGGYEIKDESFWSFDPDDRTAKKAVKRMSGLQAVGCEACHGPGSRYKSKKTMVAIYNGEIEGEIVGLMSISEAICLNCHNEKSPTYKPFVYEERIKNISHPIP